MWTDVKDFDRKILIDCDIIRHFIRGQQIDVLHKIFPDNLYILDIVEHEINRSERIKPIVDKLISDRHLKQMTFPIKPDMIAEYSKLKDKEFKGPGESACMAVARFSKDIIASNNLNDIKIYCVENSILYLTTMDFLYVAYRKGILDEAEIDYFLYLNLTGANPSRIGFTALQIFIDTNPSIHILFESISA
ncbi:hypothetical protein [Fluviicola sp.]|uniref:hypothetical protein n=1 Tax=Fluviicola sp. TaxID=1917219 RepID=UPI003D2CDB66